MGIRWFVLLIAAVFAMPAEGFQGLWHGTLEAGQSFRLGLNIAKAADGSLSGRLDSYDQGARGIHLDVVSEKGNSIRFEIRAIGAVYEGNLNADGTEISGQWNQSGLSLPLKFARGAFRPEDLPKSEPKTKKKYAGPDDLIADWMKSKRIPGLSVAIVRNGEAVHSKGYGTANLEHEVAATPDTVYLLASITKQFTAALIMMLVEEGKIDLDESIRKYLSDGPESWKAITVRQLLTHTSGLKHRFEGASASNWLLTFSKEAMYKSACTLAPDFEPGARWQYSDQGYFLLGMIIEKVSGAGYRDLLAERIFKPLGMTASDILNKSAVIKHLAPNYIKQRANHVRSRERDAEYGLGSHYGMVSSVVDLAKWDAALYSERLLKKSSLEAMWTPAKLANGAVVYSSLGMYGLGWFLDDFRGHRIVQHGGSTGTSIFRLPDDRVTVIVLTNLEGISGTEADKLASDLAALYVPDITWGSLKETPDPDPKLSQELKEELARFVKGEPDLSRYTPEIAPSAKAEAQAFLKAQKSSGVFSSLNALNHLARETSPSGLSLYYRAVFSGITMSWRFILTSDKKIARFQYSVE